MELVRRIYAALCFRIRVGRRVAGVGCNAAAQGGLGAITGTAIDQTEGAFLAPTFVCWKKRQVRLARSVSNEAGLFNVQAVPPGTYTVTISLSSFKTKQFDNLALSSFQQLSLGTVTLELALGPSDAIEVTATAPILDIDSGVRHETIEAQPGADMPLQGRNWATLMKVVPGSNPTNDAPSTDANTPRAGMRTSASTAKTRNQTQVNLDGGSIVDHGNDAKTSVAPSLESIQEIAVLTNNFQAEYGNRGGTVINVVTKSGTNQVHGAFFDYIRNEALNAGSWEDNFNGKREVEIPVQLRRRKPRRADSPQQAVLLLQLRAVPADAGGRAGDRTRPDRS